MSLTENTEITKIIIRAITSRSSFGKRHPFGCRAGQWVQAALSLRILLLDTSFVKAVNRATKARNLVRLATCGKLFRPQCGCIIRARHALKGI